MDAVPVSVSDNHTTQWMLRWQAVRQAFRCATCDTACMQEIGLAFVLVPENRLACHACGRSRSPALSALMQLAQIAQEVGRIQQHHPREPTLSNLLRLAQAAEKYLERVELKK